MKYTATEKNPWLKEGQEFTFESGDTYPDIAFYGLDVVVRSVCKKTWITNEYCKEVQKKEFTKDDMIEFHDWCFSNPRYNTHVQMFEAWKDNRKETLK